MSPVIRRLAFGLLAALVLILPVCVPGCTSPSLPVVRIGYLLGDLHHLPFFVAQEEGFFKDEGINVQVMGPFDAGPAEMDALAANQLDMGYVGVSPAILAAARKVDLSIIAGVNLEGSALVTAEDIDDVTELKSRKVATPAPGSIQYILMGMVLASDNMTFKDVELFPGTINPPDMPPALQTGRIDGYCVWEPFAAESVVSGAGKVLVESKDIWPGHPCCVVVTRNDFAAKNSSLVAAVVRAHEKAVKFIADNPAAAKTIAQKWTKLDKAVIENAFPRVKYTYTLNTDDVKRFVSEIIKLGADGTIKPIITAADVPDVDAFINKVVDLKYLQR
jgi:NitT/TauT family transport system substrate-binding protein